MLADIQLVAEFLADEVENRGAAGSAMSDYEAEALSALEAFNRIREALAALQPDQHRNEGGADHG